jgi:DNA-binding MarR family transcriptional regulator
LSEPPGAIPDLDRAIHEPARLGIVALLYVVEAADFTFVQQKTALTAGNLSAHVSKLESAGYLEVEKTFSERRPLTTLRLTRRGRAAFVRYVEEMRGFLERVVGPGSSRPRGGSGRAGRA